MNGLCHCTTNAIDVQLQFNEVLTLLFNSVVIETIHYFAGTVACLLLFITVLFFPNCLNSLSVVTVLLWRSKLVLIVFINHAS